MVDAGSSGSRAYLYHWPEENTSDLLKITPLTDVKNEPLVKSVSPGKNFTNVLSISFGDLLIHNVEVWSLNVEYSVIHSICKEKLMNAKYERYWKICM